MFASDSEDYSAAMTVYEDYKNSFPKEWYGYFYSILPLLMLGRADAAIKQAETCEKYPDVSASALLHMVACHVYNQNQEGAKATIKKLTDAGQLARAAYGEALIAHVSGNWEEALKKLDSAAADQSLIAPAKATLSKAIILADAGRTDQAINVLNEAAEADGRENERDRWAEKRISLAMLHEQIGNRSDAVQALSVLRRENLGPENAGWAGVLFARFGDKDAAEQKLKSIPELPYPKFQISRLQIQAEQQFAVGNKKQGLVFAEAAKALEPLAFGSEYFADSLLRARDSRALLEYKDCQLAKSIQFFLVFPAPVGSCYRAAQAVRHLQPQK
jgi:tetratricopeptide (TPR) repeat protein